MVTLKLGTTSTFVTSINWALPLSPVRRANGRRRQPVAATAEGTATGTAMQQQRLIEQEEKGRARDEQQEDRGRGREKGWKGGRGEPQCWRNERKKDSSPRRLHARPFPFPAALPPFPRPAFSCELSSSCTRRAQTGFAIKRILSRNVRDHSERI